jgi:DNA polymerase III gamma/tau subunit
MATSLAVKYRPKLLKDFLGNEDVTKSLRSMMEREEIPHTLLFTGPSGCGKTTLARIVAARLKCSSFDFTENNAADFRGIDSVRDILRQMTLSPMNGPCRIWLLDEAHQLSRDAQHALLKALEDTPTHVYFLLATTDPEKLLPTIKTRCVTFDVKPLSDQNMTILLDIVADKELGTPLRKEITDQIVQDSLGSARMSLSILDKILNMDAGDMLEAAKQQAANVNEAIDLCRALIGKKPWPVVAKIIKGIQQEPESVRRAVLGYAQSVLLGSNNGQAYIVLDAFRQPFYDLGKPGLTMAAYMAVS